MGAWMIIGGVISLILTTSDPVFALTYRFPNSPYDTISHKWDCLSFGGLGVSFGVVSIIAGLTLIKFKFNKESNNIIALNIYLYYFVCCVTFVAVGCALYARQNQVSDPNLSHDIAITSEGFELPYQMRCGEYMNLHHPVGFVGALFWSFSFLGVIVLFVGYHVLKYVLKFLIYILTCKSVCPELDKSLERDLEKC